MKGTVKKIVLLFCMVVLFTSCGVSSENTFKDNRDIETQIYDYLDENKMTSISEVELVHSRITLFKRKKERGVARFILNKENKEIKYINVDTVVPEDKEDKLIYFQFKDMDRTHFVVFILDEELLKRATDVRIDFHEKGENDPIGIQISLNGEGVLIDNISRRGTNRIIKKISLLEDGKEIYSEEN
ncbi:hypothetical protein [Anaeromicrobium sediminis]|uniref:hypothetical protein n=1 Tax=Anaeromicrobium sediminis TaxID=1478221 RepID=UPI0011407990|nr:hypothetical protein [Anaeromicrobium sediminis]